MYCRCALQCTELRLRFKIVNDFQFVFCLQIHTLADNTMNKILVPPAIWSWKWKEEGRRPVGRPKKTWTKVMEEDMRKLNITEDMVKDRKQWRQLISHTTPGVGN